MTLKIISASQIVFTGKVKSVTLPGEKGAFTVLNNHASLISTLSSGKITYLPESASATEDTVSIDCPGGVADVDQNIVSVCIY